LRSLSFRKLPLVAALLLLAQAAAAQFPRDDAASRKIREAIDSHYLATNFDKAEDVLSGTIAACADQCSPQVLARAWMYLGLVRGSGKNDLVGAKEAFKKALELDPAVELDGTLATDATQQAFVEAGGAATKPPPAAKATAEPAPAEPAPAKPAPEPPPPAPKTTQPAAEDCPPNFPGCGDGAKQAAPVDAYAKNWFGLHVAGDLTFVGGTDVCTQDSQANDDFACYYAGSRSGAYIDEPYPGVESSTTLVYATTRILLSYDRALSANLMLGARIGYAFGGGPPSGRDVIYEGQRIASVVSEGLAFFPFHLEARASYWFGSTPLAKPGLRPYVHLGGGLAQVDAKIGVTVKDCGLVEAPTDPNYAQLYADCASGRMPANDPHLRDADLDAWKKLGQGFITIGGGAVYAFTSGLGAQLNLNLMYTLPGSGVVIEPSLGAVMGF
jgi:hypothetical protein